MRQEYSDDPPYRRKHITTSVVNGYLGRPSPGCRLLYSLTMKETKIPPKKLPLKKLKLIR